MIANPDQFQPMLLENNQSCLKINNKTIKMANCVQLLGINIDSNLYIDSHITDLCKKTSMQLNALNCLSAYIGNKEIQISIKSFFTQTSVIAH